MEDSNSESLYVGSASFRHWFPKWKRGFHDWFMIRDVIHLINGSSYVKEMQIHEENHWIVILLLREQFRHPNIQHHSRTRFLLFVLDSVKYYGFWIVLSWGPYPWNLSKSFLVYGACPACVYTYYEAVGTFPDLSHEDYFDLHPDCRLDMSQKSF